MNEFCSFDCEYLSLTEQQQKESTDNKTLQHVCTKYNSKLFHLLAHPNLYKCESCYRESLISKVEADHKIFCPDCHKELKLMSINEEKNKVVALYHCPICLNSIDSDWQVTYTTEDHIIKIERYTWG